MNLEFLRDIWKQFVTNWKNFTAYQKFSIAIFVAILAGAFFYIVAVQEKSAYAPLFQHENLPPSEVSEVEAYLVNAHIRYTMGPNSTIYVPANRLSEIRNGLNEHGIPKRSYSKGFDLFDTNTWIKGEKELQILELRALKGQLEQDISKFNNIRDASVILDIATPRTFGNNFSDKTKASVILSLKPGTVLSQSEIQAITYHIAGAVRGLKPNMVAISDTTGRLYQPLDADNATDAVRIETLLLEESIKAKIDSVLSAIIGPQNFIATLHLDAEGITADILINSAQYKDEAKVRKEIESRVQAILSSYMEKSNVHVDFTEFYKKTVAMEKSVPDNMWPLIEMLFIAAGIIILLIGGLIWLLSRRRPREKTPPIKEYSHQTLEEMIETLKMHVQRDPRPLAKVIHNSLKKEKYD